MKKIRIGIYGYGNLGKSLEKLVNFNTTTKLIAIFSKRADTLKFQNQLIVSSKNVLSYKGKIDVMLIASGSNNGAMQDTEFLSRYFNTINSFDTHEKILPALKRLDKICKQSHTLSIISCGWDPGLFSCARAVFAAILDSKAYTFYGKGVSLGHSNAVRRINGVIGAVSFTLKDKNSYKRVKTNNPPENISHERKVYIHASLNANKEEIKQQVLNMPHYFLGSNATVTFVDKNKISELKKQLYHAGEVLATGKIDNIPNSKAMLSLKAKMTSNPLFTAKIMLLYAKNYANIKKIHKIGAYTPLDFAPSIFYKNRFNMIKEFC